MKLPTTLIALIDKLNLRIPRVTRAMGPLCVPGVGRQITMRVARAMGRLAQSNPLLVVMPALLLVLHLLEPATAALPDSARYIWNAVQVVGETFLAVWFTFAIMRGDRLGDAVRGLSERIVLLLLALVTVRAVGSPLAQALEWASAKPQQAGAFAVGALFALAVFMLAPSRAQPTRPGQGTPAAGMRATSRGRSNNDAKMEEQQTRMPYELRERLDKLHGHIKDNKWGERKYVRWDETGRWLLIEGWFLQSYSTRDVDVFATLKKAQLAEGDERALVKLAESVGVLLLPEWLEARYEIVPSAGVKPDAQPADQQGRPSAADTLTGLPHPLRELLETFAEDIRHKDAVRKRVSWDESGRWLVIDMNLLGAYGSTPAGVAAALKKVKLAEDGNGRTLWLAESVGVLLLPKSAA